METNVETLLRGTRAAVPVLLPLEKPAQLVPLTRSETQQCIADAIKRFKDLGIPHDSMVYRSDFEDEVLNQLLFYSLRNKDDQEKRFAPTADELRNFLTPPEQANLFDAYERNFGDIDPSPESLTAKQHEDIIEAVKKKDLARLRLYGWAEVVSCMLTSEHPPES